MPPCAASSRPPTTKSFTSNSMEKTRNIAPVKLELLVAIVHNEKVKYYSSIIRSHQANMQFFMPAQGSSHLLMNYLGLTEKPKSLLASVVRSDEAQSLINELQELFKKGDKYKGVAFTVKLTSVVGTVVYGFLSNDRRTINKQ